MKPPSHQGIENIFAGKPNLETLRDYLLKWKAIGLSQQDCKKLLINFRANTELDEETDDLLLEWLDIVVGFCSPHQKVW